LSGHSHHVTWGFIRENTPWTGFQRLTMTQIKSTGKTPQEMTAVEALRAARSRHSGPARVFIPGCSGEPLLLADGFASVPELAADCTFFGIWIPGVNRTDWAGFHEKARSEQIFLSHDWQSSYREGRARYLPLSYTQAWRWLSEADVDIAIVQVSPPDGNGNCSFGVSSDFSGAIWPRAKTIIAHINPSMPSVPTSESIPYNAFDFVVLADHPVLQVQTPQLDPAFDAIARQIADLIPNGASLQFGLGKVQLAVLAALKGKTGLHVHSGMISDPILDLIDTNAISSITTGVALGSAALYHCVSAHPKVKFAPVGYTHDIRTLAAIDTFIAINSIIEIDLFGQANAEFINGAQISGTGGLVDFLRGARASTGGLPIVALNATAKGGAISRIVPRLDTGAVSIARADIGIVVTEHGRADLRQLDDDARAHALISLAAPEHRPHLEASWTKTKVRLDG